MSFLKQTQALFQALKDSTTTLISIFNRVSGTCFRLQEFRTFKTSHVRRQVNKPAHTLATYAKDIVSFVT